MLKSNEALNRNSDIMREIAFAAKEENKLIAIALEKSQKDSRMIKILTVITMTYLPASLIAVSSHFAPNHRDAALLLP